MGATKKVYLRISEEILHQEFTPMQISMFESYKVVYDNEWEDNKDDPNYSRLYKDIKKAKEAKEKYLFNKRHGGSIK